MPYSTADISSAEQSGEALDAPLLVGSNLIEAAKDDGSFVARWVADGDTTTADATDSDFPIRRAYDRYTDLVTKPNASGTEWWLVFDFNATLNDFDVALIGGGHNLAANSATIALYVSDAADIKTANNQIATWTPSAASGNREQRLVSLDLDDGANAQPQVFSDVRYFGVKITAGVGFVPEITDVWIGKRRQIHKRPQLPYNPDQQFSDVRDKVSMSGIRTRYSRNRGQRVLTPSWTTDTAARAQVFTDLWTDCNEGTKPVLHVEKPNSDSNTMRVMYLQSSLPGGAHDATNVRRWAMQLEETAPFLAREG